MNAQTALKEGKIMHTITLDNGFKYQAYWGGQPYNPPENSDIGPCCMIRQYHDLTLWEIGGIKWIEEYQKDHNFPEERYAHHNYFSCDGKHKISSYYRLDGSIYFVVYKASTHRHNMQSTFGNYLFSKDREFKSFEACAKAVSENTALY